MQFRLLGALEAGSGGTVVDLGPPKQRAVLAILLLHVGEIVSTEVRAKHVADPAVSLNVWAPVVNTLRHPAWGRNEEGYSEDAWLTGLLGQAYAQGLRGDHPTLLKTAPTLKHFLGYNNENDRCTSSSNLGPRVLHEYELPAYRPW